jgi:hypothetical protein
VQEIIDNNGACALKVAANRPPSSCHSRSSRASASSEARFLLAEKKAKTAAAQICFNKKQNLKEEAVKNKLAAEEQAVRHERRVKEVEIERQQLENQFMEVELNKLDNIADELEEAASRTDVLKPPEPRCSTDVKLQFNHEIGATNSFKNPQFLNLGRPRPNFLATANNNEPIEQNNINHTQNTDLSKLTQILARQHEKSTLPQRKLEIFSGEDVTKYPKFIKSFVQLVHNKCNNPSYCLYYLEQYTDGRAR